MNKKIYLHNQNLEMLICVLMSAVEWKGKCTLTIYLKDYSLFLIKQQTTANWHWWQIICTINSDEQSTAKIDDSIFSQSIKGMHICNSYTFRNNYLWTTVINIQDISIISIIYNILYERMSTSRNFLSLSWYYILRCTTERCEVSRTVIIFHHTAESSSKLVP